jgi:D-cysteine desulfhydrase
MTLPTATFPKQSLGFFPTPLIDLPRLSQALKGPRILMKRDDQSGLALGGNKTRKLEYLLGEAVAQGADTIITAGAAQSNHCRQTAAAAARLNLECHLVLGGAAPRVAGGNLLLDTLFGAQIHWAGAHRKGEDIPALVETLRKQGKKPQVIPYGGSNAVGALAFIDAIGELHTQIQSIPTQVSHIIFASSSGGTQAGLMLGNVLLGNPFQLIGVNIDKDEHGAASFPEKIIQLANETAQLLNIPHAFSAKDLCLNSDYVGDGYGIVGDAEREAIRMTAQLEGILVDPVYTGRAMAALIDLIRRGTLGPSDTVVFWHTGGAPALFAYADTLQ